MRKAEGFRCDWRIKGLLTELNNKTDQNMLKPHVKFFIYAKNTMKRYKHNEKI